MRGQGDGQIATQTRLSHRARQQQIVDAARELIASGGADALTVRAVADRVGVTEAAIYRHVTSKDEVLLLLINDVHDSLFSALRKSTSEGGSALEKLNHLLELHLSYVELRRGISFMVIAEAAQFQEPRVRAAGKNLVEEYLKHVQGLITEGQRQGEIASTVNAAAAATTFFGMIQAAVTKWLFDASAHPLTENAGAMWALFSSALGSPAEGSNGRKGG